MAGESLCTNLGFRNRWGLISNPPQQIRDLFRLDPAESAKLEAFRREWVERDKELPASVIRDQFVRPVLESAAQRAGRKSPYGLFVRLFGEGNWDDCFPSLAAIRVSVEREASGTATRFDFYRSDGNTVVNVPLFDVGSRFGFFQWGNGRDDYAYGEVVRQIMESGVTVVAFERITNGRCPSEGNAAYDSRWTIALFKPCSEERLTRSLFPKKKLSGKEEQLVRMTRAAFGMVGEELTPELRDLNSKFLLAHELRHQAKEVYLLNRLFAVAEKDQRWNAEAAFHCLASETLADFAALDSFGEGEKRRAVLFYGAEHRIQGKGTGCASESQRLAWGLVSSVLKKGDQWEETLFESKVSEIRSFFEEYFQIATARMQEKMMEEEGLDGRAEAMEKAKADFKGLSKFEQRRRIEDTMVALFLRDKSNGRMMQELIHDWQTRFSELRNSLGV